LLKKLSGFITTQSEKLKIDWEDIGIVLGADTNSLPEDSAVNMFLGEKFEVSS